MPGPTVLLWDNAANRPVSVPSSEAAAKVAAGTHANYSRTASQTVTNVQGLPATRTPAEAAVAQSMGETLDLGYADAAAAASQRRRAAFDTLADGAAAVLDGFKDAASLGLLHDHGEKAELRNDVHAGKHFAGQVGGFLTTALIPGGGANVARAGAAKAVAGSVAKVLPVGLAERGAAAIARGVVPESAVGAAKVLGTAAREGIVGGVTGAAYSVGHQLSDAIIEDKPFVSERVADEMGIGILTGGVFGAAAGAFERAAAKARGVRAMSDQGGLVNPRSDLSRKVHGRMRDAASSYGNAVRGYRDQYRVLQGLQDAGKLPRVGDMLGPRRVALEEAERAAARFDRFNVDEVLAKGSAKDIERMRDAWVVYRRAADRVQDAFRPKAHEMANAWADGNGARALKLDPDAANAIADKANANRGHMDALEVEKMRGMGAQNQLGALLDANMVVDDAALARYREIYGEDFVPNYERIHGGGEPSGGVDTDRFYDDAATPTAGTNPGRKVRAEPTPIVPPRRDTLKGIDGLGQQTEDILASPLDVDLGAGAPVADPTMVGRRPLPELGGATRVDSPAPRARQAMDPLAGVDVAPRPFGPSDDFAGAQLTDIDQQVVSGVPRMVEKLDGGKKVRLDDGRVVWRSEHRNMLKDALRSSEAYRAINEGLEETLAKSVEDPFKGFDGNQPTVANPGRVKPGNEPTVKIDRAQTQVDSAPSGAVQEVAGSQTIKSPRPDMTSGGDKTVIDNAAKELAKADMLERKMLDAFEKGEAKAAEAAKRELAAQRKRADEAFDAAETEINQSGYKPDAPQGPVRPWKAGGGGDPHVVQYLEEMARLNGPVVSPGDKAAVELMNHLQQLESATGGRLQASSALDIARQLGIKNPTSGDPLADAMVQLWAVRRMGEQTVRKGEAGFWNRIGRGMAIHGGYVAGGPVGAMIAGSAAFSGGLASFGGKARNAVVEAGHALLKNKRARVAAWTTREAAYSYDGTTPTKDVHTRLDQLALAVADEDATRTRIRRSLGDLPSQEPEIARAIEDTTWRRMMNLSVRAPTYLVMGNRKLEPAKQQLRRFREYEDATWDPSIIFRAIAAGAVTATMADALHDQHPEAARMLCAQLLGQGDALNKLPERTLKQVELICRVPLTRGSDPLFVMRQQGAPSAVPAEDSKQPKAQALSISAPPPTPSQAGPKAPGN